MAGRSFERVERRHGARDERYGKLLGNAVVVGDVFASTGSAHNSAWRDGHQNGDAHGANTTWNRKDGEHWLRRGDVLQQNSLT